MGTEGFEDKLDNRAEISLNSLRICSESSVFFTSFTSIELSSLIELF